MTGNVFNIQRFSVSDGPGIRTTVFLKGCPLSCEWCHNPESNKTCKELFFNSEKCIGCGACASVCKNMCHSLDETGHVFLRNDCVGCFSCAQVCGAKAIEVCGNEMSADDVVKEALRDAEFYKQSGGGITLSGGEPLLQFDFSLEILKAAKQHGLHTAVETSGYTHRELCDIIRYVDIWLFDIKLTDDAEHKKYTGVSRERIVENLLFLDKNGCKTVLRCPIIPDINMNSRHFEEMSKLANSLDNVQCVQFEPYHPLGVDKAKRIGKTQKYNSVQFLDKSELLPFVEGIRAATKTELQIV